MEGVLAAMTGVRLYILPDTSPWTLDLFVHNTWLTCCQAAQVQCVCCLGIRFAVIVVVWFYLSLFNVYVVLLEVFFVCVVWGIVGSEIRVMGLCKCGVATVDFCLLFFEVHVFFFP